MGTTLPDLSNIDVRALLRKLGDLTDSIVVVGGQAVSIWAELYKDELPPDLRRRPLTSKDIDFTGGKKAVRLAADRLDGETLFPGPDDHNTPNIGVVKYVDLAGVEREIDFLDVPHGLKSAKDVNRRAQRVELLDENDRPTGQRFRVLNPIHTLQSRMANVATLPGGDSEAGLKQLRAAVATARGFIRDVLARAGARAALRVNEEVFRLAMGLHGLDLFAKHGIDVFDAVIADPSLPETFRSKRYPQMKERLSSKRRRGAR